MSRRRWVYRPAADGTVEAIEVTAEREPTARLEFSVDRHYEGLRATDGTDIGSRQKHREYMRIHGLTTADDYKETWAKAAKERADLDTGNSESHKREVRESISRAFYELEKKRSRR